MAAKAKVEVPEEDKKVWADKEKAITEAPVWIGGQGTEQHMTVARTHGEALNNLFEIEPLLVAIGCTAEQLEDVDGCKIVAKIPKGFVFGDDRRLLD